MIQGILLAAGIGRRFQDEIPNQDKLLMTLPNNKTVLAQSAYILTQVLPNSIAVVQPNQIARKEILQDLGLTVIESLDAKNGMGHAIADAVNQTRRAEGWLITLADMPWIDSQLILQLSTNIIEPNSIAAPKYKDRRGQPVAFGSAWFNELSNLKGDVGARGILRNNKINWVNWSDDSIHRDVDMPADLQYGLA
jgi:molybdenum cofactor cytidylyltransferase